MMSSRLNPDTRPVVLATTGLVAFLGLVSFAVSFNGLVAVAAWAELVPWLRWAVPAFVDGAMVAYTLAMFIQRARDESTWFSWFALGGFTAVSVGANAAHVLGTGRAGDWRTLVGAGIAALAPLGVFAATHTLAGLIIARPDVVQVGPAPVPDPPLLASEWQDTRDEVRALRAKGLTHRDIAGQLGISKSTVSRWLVQSE